MSPTSDTPPTSRPAGTSWTAFVTVGALFVVAYFVARGGLENVEQGSSAALALAFLPVPFFVLLVAFWVHNVRALDELERRIQLEALAIAYPVALLIVFTVGLLDLAGFHGAQDWDLPRLWPLILVPYFFGLWRARVRYA
jgi:hypothetical protein